MTQSIGGYVLAGGLSRRMQAQNGEAVDKASIPWPGADSDATLLDHAIDLLTPLCTQVTVLCGAPERCQQFAVQYSTLSDKSFGEGPVRGLESALLHASQEWLLLLPVDLPLLPRELLQRLIDAAVVGSRSVVCLSAGGILQPLPVLIHRTAAAPVSHLVAKGERKLLSVLEGVAEYLGGGLHILPEHKLRPKEDPEWFLNCNTPADLQRAREIASNRFAASASE